MVFDLEDCLELLLDARAEEFSHERVIRLFQFQTWIWYPYGRGHAAIHAGRIAAAAILRKLEKEHRWRGLQGAGGSRRISLAKLQMLSQSDAYRSIFTEFVSSGGGWSNLLFTTPSAHEFDKRIKKRISVYADFVANLIEYRLRAARTLPELPRRSGPTHAIFFNCQLKKKDERTGFNLWQPFRRTAAFIYLIERRGFRMKPFSADDVEFCDHLMYPQISGTQLQRFFCEYQFVADELGDETFCALPQVVQRAEIKIKPFSAEERSIIAANDERTKKGRSVGSRGRDRDTKLNSL